MKFCPFSLILMLLYQRQANLPCRIRPLLSQDIKIRRITGRRQISGAGVHLFDGVVFGRPLLRLADRPAVNIPPRKKRRITYDEEHSTSETLGALEDALEGKETEESQDDNGNRQLILHADFDDEDLEEDEDFAPQENVLDAEFDDDDSEDEDDFNPGEDDEEADLEDDDSEVEDDDQNTTPEREENSESPSEDIEKSLLDVRDSATRVSIRKLQAAFPTSKLGVCKHILRGTGNNMGEAYEALLLGFKPVKPKSAVTEISQGTGDLSVPKTRRAKAPPAPAEQTEIVDSMQVERAQSPVESPNPLVDFYDQNGLPPGSIASGKALKFMADAVNSSPSRRPDSRSSAASSKIVRFADTSSTPIIDKETQDVEGSDEGSDDSSEEESSSDSDSSEVSSDSSDEEEENAPQQSSSSSSSDSESDSDSSFDSSSDEEEPEVKSSKTSAAAVPKTNGTSSSLPDIAAPKHQSRPNFVPPGEGMKGTRKRNDRRRKANALNRYKETGILPAGTTVAEFEQLAPYQLSSSEAAATALEALRANPVSEKISNIAARAVKKADEFEQRRNELMASIAEGGIDISKESAQKALEMQYPTRETDSAQPSAENISRHSAPPSPAEGTKDIPIGAENCLAGMSFVFTGTLEKISRGDVLALVKRHGGKTINNPNRNTTYAVLGGDPEPAKLSKITDLKIKILTADELFALISKLPANARGNKTEKATNSVVVEQVSLVTAPISTPVPEVDGTNLDAMAIDGVVKPSTASAKPKVDAPLVSSTEIKAAESTPAPSEPRRRKLDLGAGRRMLFGSLGIRNPKSREDEEKLRNDLMKDVRPLITPKTVEQPKTTVDEPVNEDPEAWKASITYRAVECVQDNIELSEPPFPFKQRWDPKQQNDRGGKRKQRDQVQYYDDTRVSKKQKRRKGKDKHYSEARDNLEEPLELSYDDNYDTQYDESTQFSRHKAHDSDGEISQNLIHDTQDTSQAVSQNPEDLAPLPEDPSALPKLAQGAAKIGMTVAFKCLEMSEATNWQPRISPYRTAVVVSLSENGELQLSLAMRDRKPGRQYNEETGERIYGKFEMPADDDEMDEDDDGMLYLSFGDLHEPKIVQEAPAGSADTQMSDAPLLDEVPKGNASATSSNEEGSTEGPFSQVEAQYSHVTETPLNSQAPEQPESMQIEDFEEVVENTPAQGCTQTPGPEGPSQAYNTSTGFAKIEFETADPVTPGLRIRDPRSVEVLTPSQQITDENRREISIMMKDAGFRSSIPSSIMRGIQPETPSDTQVFRQLMKDMTETPRDQKTPYSPKFNGFGISQPGNEADITFDITESSPVADQPARQLAASSEASPQSNWQTVDSQLESPIPTPPQAGQEQASVSVTNVYEDVAEEESNSPTPEPVRQSVKKILPRKVPVSKAQELWEQLQPKSQRTSVDSAASEEISQAISPASYIGLDGTGEKGSNTSVEYPKLSVVSSSFRSQIADHGRQPDFDLDDSALLNMDTSKISNSERTSSNSKNISRSNLELDAASTKSVSEARDNKPLIDPLSDSEPELPTRTPVGGRVNNPSRVPDIQEDESDSDPFPTLEALSQQSHALKKEKASSAPPLKTKEPVNKKDLTIFDYEVSDDEITPKPSRKQQSDLLKRTTFTKSKVTEKPALSSRKTAPPASLPQPRTHQAQASQSRASQSRPSQSQPGEIWDLTQTSSEAEEAEPALRVPQRFRKQDLDEDEDDDDYAPELEKGGWVPKNTSILGLGGARRHTGPGIKDSSQAGLNARRKTSSR